MRFSILALTAFAAAVSAQGLSDLPQCAQTCVGNSLSSTGCNGLQIQCICQSSGWIAGLSCCVKTACSTADQQTTIKFASQLCSTYGVTLPTDVNAACAAASNGTASASGSANASTSRAASSVTSTAAPATRTGSANKDTVGYGVALAGLLAALV